jgi:hypothetical protein
VNGDEEKDGGEEDAGTYQREESYDLFACVERCFFCVGNPRQDGERNVWALSLDGEGRGCGCV